MFQINNIETYYNLLERRRKIFLMVIIAVLILSIFFLFLASTLSQIVVNGKKITTLKKEVKLLNTQLTIFTKRKQEDKSIHLVKEKRALKQSLKIATEKVALHRNQLISAKEVYINLKDIFQQDHRIELVNIKHYPRTSIEATQGDPVFRYPILLTVKGSFEAILAYLKKIEQQHNYIFWDEMTYTVTRYPDALLNLKFHVVTSKVGDKNEVQQ